MQVNRCLADPAMDDIDHALGRPFDPCSESFRNRFAVMADDRSVGNLDRSPLWRRVGAAGDMILFEVTCAGRRALADHLAHIADPHRAYEISFDGHESVVIAASAAKARYRYWLGLRDVAPDLTFHAFCPRVRCRRQKAAVVT